MEQVGSQRKGQWGAHERQHIHNSQSKTDDNNNNLPKQIKNKNRIVRWDHPTHLHVTERGEDPLLC